MLGTMSLGYLNVEPLVGLGRVLVPRERHELRVDVVPGADSLDANPHPIDDEIVAFYDRGFGKHLGICAFHVVQHTGGAVRRLALRHTLASSPL
jgi:hypothetical protein